MKNNAFEKLCGFFFLLMAVTLFAPSVARAIPATPATAAITSVPVSQSILGDEDYNVDTAVAGDFNGDGTTDTAVCVPEYDTTIKISGVASPKSSGFGISITSSTTPSSVAMRSDTGAVFIFTADVENGSVLSDASIVIKGKAKDDQLGESCAVGDFNGDGMDDLLEGAHHNDDGGSNTGSGYLIFGSTALASGNIADNPKTIQYTGEVISDYAGMVVANAGDVNGDGYDDLVIGSRNNDDGGSGAGAAYLILGSKTLGDITTLTMTSLSGAIEFYGYPSDQAGHSVSGVGDVNGDGYDDILIGAYSNDEVEHSAGAAYIVLGNSALANSGGSLSSDAIKLTGEYKYDYAASSIAGAGDVNDDGYDDMLISGGDFAYLVLGNSTLANSGGSLSTADAKYENENGASSISCVASAGDVNSDGYADILLGSMFDGNDYSHGAAYLILGKASPTSTTLTASGNIRKFVSETEHDYPGSFVGPASTGKFFIGANGYGSGSEVLDNSPGKIWLVDQSSLPFVNLRDSSKSWIKTLP